MELAREEFIEAAVIVSVRAASPVSIP